MKVLNDNYLIRKEGIHTSNKRFISLSDLHYGVLQQLFYKGYMKKLFEYIIKSNYGKKVDAIIIPGDLIFWINKYQDKYFIKVLKRDLEKLAFTLQAPVFVSYGNHDLPFKEESLSEEEKKEWELANYIENRNQGTFILNNVQYKIDNVVITGFSPTRDAYNPNAMPDKAIEIAKESFDKCNFRFNKENINILLSHDNKFFTHRNITQNYNELYNDLTLIIGGHLHDGYIPIWLQRMFSDELKDYGIWEKFPPKIDMCRGAFKVSQGGPSKVILPNEEKSTTILLNEDETASIVNRGIAKYSWFIPSTPSIVTVEIEEENKLTLKR